MMAELEALRAEKALAQTLGDIKVDLWEGVNKRGKASRKIKITGGAFGGWGISLNPHQWDELMRLSDHISAKVDEYRPTFVNATD